MSKEHDFPHEFEPAVIAGYMETFINRTEQFPLQIDDGSYISVNHQITANIVTSHLRGRLTLGTYVLNASHEAKWLCLDADDEEQWCRLQTLAAVLDSQNVPTYLEESRRGGHVWLFFAPHSGADVRRFGYQLLAEQELTGIELYPKQDRLVTGTGSLVRLPLGIHRKTGKRYVFITQTGTLLAPTIREQLTLLARPERVENAYIDQILSRAPETHTVAPTFPFRQAEFTKTRDRLSGQKLSDQIKAAVSVREFVSQYVQLDKRGLGYCPFHDDQHRSFGVSDEGNYWHCFAGCGGGSLIDFWMKWREKHGEDSSFTTTISELAGMLLM